MPLWDMSSIFPGLESPEYRAAVARLNQQVADLGTLFEEEGVTGGKVPTPESLETVLSATNALLSDLETIGTYAGCLVTVNTRDQVARAAESELDKPQAEVRKLLKRLTTWLATVPAELDLGEVAADHRYSIERAQTRAKHLLPAEQESLVSDLELTGSSAWTKLYGTVSSQIEVTISSGTFTISQIRAMASDAARADRKTAYEAELAAWKQFEEPIAACMNGIKGETLTLAERRAWSSPLAEACFGAAMDESILDAMMTAARESYPMFRRYLKLKARALGNESLAFYDIFAPLPGSDREWPWEEGAAFVAEQFERYSPKLGELARRSYRENWHDVPSRPGKVDGAYCAGIRGGESRILHNYRSSLDSVRTLAHELGHAYHNLCLEGRSALQHETPMTLAETASIFCETVVKNAVLETGTESERLSVLESSITGACQVVVDISSRFLFEQSVFEARKKRELSASELCELMLAAQKETYGDGLSVYHPYMWAAKPHYYSRESYYNFPYMFGLLFGLGLYAHFRAEPTGFHARYDALLSRTGMADAAILASDFGIDIRTPDFWRASLAQIGEDIVAFEGLIGG